MVIDSSAFLAILQDEPESQLFRERILADTTRIVSAPTLLELSTVVLARQGEVGLITLQDFLRKGTIETAPFQPEHVPPALDAFRRFGKGRHRAGLNFGDCFAYALAKATNEPLLFKGDGFIYTDVASAS